VDVALELTAQGRRSLCRPPGQDAIESRHSANCLSVTIVLKQPSRKHILEPFSTVCHVGNNTFSPAVQAVNAPVITVIVLTV
jgi:hypothetical protein